VAYLCNTLTDFGVRNAPISTWLGLIGTTLVVGHGLIRLASLHHVDLVIGRKILAGTVFRSWQGLTVMRL
jgi:hypothetical protein